MMRSKTKKTKQKRTLGHLAADSAYSNPLTKSSQAHGQASEKFKMAAFLAAAARILVRKI